QELDAELARTKKFAEPPPLTEHPRGPLDFLMLQFSKVDWRKGVLFLAILIVLGGLASSWLAWWRHQNKDPLRDLPPGIYQSTQNAAGETLPLPPAPRR